MMVKKRQGSTKRERIKPQGQLGQLDGHRVEIDTVDATLHNHAFDEVDFGELGLVDLYTLPVSHILQNLRPHLLDPADHRIVRVLGQESDDSVCNKVHSVDQEM